MTSQDSMNTEDDKFHISRTSLTGHITVLIENNNNKTSNTTNFNETCILIVLK